MKQYKLKTSKTMENAVVGTYKKIENTVVGAYKKIEDKFVDTFLEEAAWQEESAGERKDADAV